MTQFSKPLKQHDEPAGAKNAKNARNAKYQTPVLRVLSTSANRMQPNVADLLLVLGPRRTEMLLTDISPNAQITTYDLA